MFSLEMIGNAEKCGIVSEAGDCCLCFAMCCVGSFPYREALALQHCEKQIKPSSSLFIMAFIWILMFHLVTASFRKFNLNNRKFLCLALGIPLRHILPNHVKLLRKKKLVQGLEGSVRITCFSCFSCRQPGGFSSQHPCGSSQPSLTPVPEDLMPSDL